MKDKTFYLNTILAAVLGIALLAVIAVRVFVPVAMLPDAGIPELVLVSLIATRALIETEKYDRVN